jgi:hypothetical protein
MYPLTLIQPVPGMPAAKQVGSVHFGKEKTMKYLKMSVASLCVMVLTVSVYAQNPGPCSNMSFQPEVLTFYGDSATVLKKMDDFKMQLPARRVYMFMLETAGSAELSLYERTDDNKTKVSHWQGTSIADLRERISSGLLENRGIACVGEQTKSLVQAKLSPKNLGTIPAPVSARAAFGHTVKAYGEDYIRVTVFLLC